MLRQKAGCCTRSRQEGAGGCRVRPQMATVSGSVRHIFTLWLVLAASAGVDNTCAGDLEGGALEGGAHGSVLGVGGAHDPLLAVVVVDVDHLGEQFVHVSVSAVLEQDPEVTDAGVRLSWSG